MLDMGARLATDRLAVVARKKEGAKPAKKDLAARATAPTSEVGHHCQLHVGTSPNATATLADHRSTWITREGVEVTSYPGVFAHGRLDDASALLLAHAEVDGAVLDLACGAGVLGETLRRRGGVSRLVLADVDHLALAAARQTAPSAEVVASDGYSNVRGPFDAIVLNPPFHRGVATDYDVPCRMLREAPDHLRRGGALWVVANRFLPYREVLDGAFSEVEEKADDGRFRLWRAVR